jgi:hypothetical protein
MIIEFRNERSIDSAYPRTVFFYLSVNVYRLKQGAKQKVLEKMWALRGVIKERLGPGFISTDNISEPYIVRSRRSFHIRKYEFRIKVFKSLWDWKKI